MQTAISNRRAHARKEFRAPAHCRFEANVVFPGIDRLAGSQWTCLDLGQGGMLLEAKESSSQNALHYEKIQNSFFAKSKPQGGVYYPALPPEQMKVSVKIRFPKKRNSFTFHGNLSWFRHVSKGVYRLGIAFREGQDIHIYLDRNGQLVMTALWREADI